ncbi:protein-L-isoaspartate(D-aspartate) O-methyltransferase [Paucibacter hankyongi]|uniref:protein-L-isoaspartate(D-aspartate) O-methyltransferase n=1 Tax=Paucibacter hankyongi TaxID=3133434 RepID=UPI0040350B95
MSNSPLRPSRFPLPLGKLVKGSSSGHVGGAGSSGSTGAVREVLMPQRHLREAAADAARLTAPRGLGLDSDMVRRRMVQRLQQEGLRDERVLQALATVQRHEFVDSALAIQAYEDTSLPIGHGQTISKPSVVGRMIAMLLGGSTASQQGHLGRTMEIGTGCGYQAAVLAELSRQVVSIERLRPLHDKARLNLAAVRTPSQIRLVYGDGRLGYSQAAPFDSIIAAAGGDDLPPAWLAQLAPGGRLVAPMVAPSGRGQILVVIDHLVESGVSRFVRTEHEAVLFVPLKSGVV